MASISRFLFASREKGTLFLTLYAQKDIFYGLSNVSRPSLLWKST